MMHGTTNIKSIWMLWITMNYLHKVFSLIEEGRHLREYIYIFLFS